MSDDHSGFIMDIKNPTRDGNYVACLVITPMLKGQADVAAKIERNMGREKCIQMAHELLSLCQAPNELLVQVHALSPDLREPITA